MRKHVTLSWLEQETAYADIIQYFKKNYGYRGRPTVRCFLDDMWREWRPQWAAWFMVHWLEPPWYEKWEKVTWDEKDDGIRKENDMKFLRAALEDDNGRG